MALVTIQHRCGHMANAEVGETSSAGIGAAVAGLQQTDCAACQALPSPSLRGVPDEALDLQSILEGQTRELQKAVLRFMAHPERREYCDVAQVMVQYADAWEDYQQERNR